MRVSPCCSVLPCKLHGHYYAFEPDHYHALEADYLILKYYFAERYYHSAKKYLTAFLTGKKDQDASVGNQIGTNSTT